MNALARATLIAAALLTSTYSALAHAHLKAQEPAADAKVSASPAALSLSFSEQINMLDDASRPKLSFPAETNATLAPRIGFPGTTIDGRTVPGR